MPQKLDARILIVDGDPDILLSARLVLKPVFSHILTTHDPHQIDQHLTKGLVNAVLLDMNFTAGFTSGKEGLRWLKRIRKQSPLTQVVLMTAYGDISLAVRAMKEGAADFVVKPWDNDSLRATLLSACQEPENHPRNTPGGAAANRGPETPTMIGGSTAMQQVHKTIEKVAATDANVLILGESGTGKELAARALHLVSRRAQGPFVHVDLRAVPETLFEAELFGHVKGAFTDARADRAGRFEAAHGGTLFLDEIGNLSLPLQAKLLSALQSRTIQRVGSNQAIPVDIRLISATNLPLPEMIMAG